MKQDYSNPVHQVYKQFVKAFFLGTQSLNIIFYSGHSETLAEDLHSWAPDWRRVERMYVLVGLCHDGRLKAFHSKALQ
jgi:hypothetical protein